MSIVKRIPRLLLILVGLALTAFVIFLIVLTILEYRPDSEEPTENVSSEASRTLSEGDQFSVMTWNIGYAGLGEASDFFMDGGSDVQSADPDTCRKYLDGIKDTINRDDVSPDVVFFQEIDKHSKRSYYTDERKELAFGDAVFTYNFNSRFVPYPMPPIGHVESGLMTASTLPVEDSIRQALPVPYKWPVRLFNLKRCLLISRVNLEDSDKQLVLVNVHLDAYSDDAARRVQADQLKDLIISEYEKGNYVITGGDFNMMFPGTDSTYPIHTDDWQPGQLTDSDIPEGFLTAYDDASPSCRLLNQPYDPTDTENTQYFVLDGFLVSPNVQIDQVRTLPEEFANSDHNPVLLKATLKTAQ